MVARDPTPRSFEEESALFRSIHEGYTVGYVEVYAPPVWDIPTDKKKVRQELNQPVRDRIETILLPQTEEVSS